MCQSHDKNSVVTPAGKTDHYSRKIIGPLIPFAKFGIGLFITGLNIATRIFIVIPVYSFWLMAFVYFNEGLFNIHAYFDGILKTSFAAAILYVAIYITMCLMFGLSCRIIHGNLRHIR